MKEGLTKAETVALWHAVDFFALSVRESSKGDAPILSGRQLEMEQARVKSAKRALRKVNELRKQGL